MWEPRRATLPISQNSRLLYIRQPTNLYEGEDVGTRRTSPFSFAPPQSHLGYIPKKHTPMTCHGVPWL